MDSTVELASELLGLECERRHYFGDGYEYNTPVGACVIEQGYGGIGSYEDEYRNTVYDDACMTPISGNEQDGLLGSHSKTNWFLRNNESELSPLPNRNTLGLEFDYKMNSACTQGQTSKIVCMDSSWYNQCETKIQPSSDLGAPLVYEELNGNHLANGRIARDRTVICDPATSIIDKPDSWNENNQESNYSALLSEYPWLPQALRIRVTSSERAGQKTASATYSILPLFLNSCSRDQEIDRLTMAKEFRGLEDRIAPIHPQTYTDSSPVSTADESSSKNSLWSENSTKESNNVNPRNRGITEHRQNRDRQKENRCCIKDGLKQNFHNINCVEPKFKTKKKKRRSNIQIRNRSSMQSRNRSGASIAITSVTTETVEQTVGTHKITQKITEKQRLETAAYDDNGNRVAGVWYDNTRRLWRVMYLEGEKRKTKGFSPRDYGYLKARDLAVALKFEKMKKA